MSETKKEFKGMSLAFIITQAVAFGLALVGVIIMIKSKSEKSLLSGMKPLKLVIVGGALTLVGVIVSEISFRYRLLHRIEKKIDALNR